MEDLFKNFDERHDSLNTINTMQVIPTTYGYEPSSRHVSKMNKNYGYSIHLVISGEGYICYEGEKPVKVKSGDLFFLLPYNKSITYYPEEKNPWNYGWMNFIGNISELLKYLNIKPSNPIVRPSARSELRKIYHDFLLATDYYAQFANIVLSSAIYNVLYILLKDAKKTQPVKHYVKYINFAQKYIEENISDPTLDLKTVAKQCSLNPTYFSRLFKLNTGMNFTTYLTTFRLNKATALIRNGVYSVKELAYAVGFSSPYYFSNQFTKMHKQRPTAYIEACKALAQKEKEENASNAFDTPKESPRKI